MPKHHREFRDSALKGIRRILSSLPADFQYNSAGSFDHGGFAEFARLKSSEVQNAKLDEGSKAG